MVARALKHCICSGFKIAGFEPWHVGHKCINYGHFVIFKSMAMRTAVPFLHFGIDCFLGCGWNMAARNEFKHHFVKQLPAK